MSPLYLGLGIGVGFGQDPVGGVLSERQFLEANLADDGAELLAYYSLSEGGGSFVSASGGVVDALGDVLGLRSDIVFSGTSRPSHDAVGFLATLDGVNDFGTTGADFDISGAVSVAIFGSLSGDTDNYLGGMFASGRFLLVHRHTADGMIKAAANGGVATSGVAASTTRRLMLASKTAGTFTLKGEVPDHAADTLIGLTAYASTLTPLVVGGLSAGSGNAPGTIRAIALLSRAYTSDDRTVLKGLGASFHSIVLAS
jgi:hypothetical protein